MERVLKFGRLIAYAVLACGIVMGTLSIGTFYYHVGNNPSKPVPALGQVYPLDNHGTFVYVTQEEHEYLEWLRLNRYLVLPALVFIFVLHSMGQRSEKGAPRVERS